MNERRGGGSVGGKSEGDNRARIAKRQQQLMTTLGKRFAKRKVGDGYGAGEPPGPYKQAALYMGNLRVKFNIGKIVYSSLNSTEFPRRTDL